MNTLVNYFFCVDGGASSTRAKLYNAEGKILSSYKTNSANIYNDVFEAVENINFLWNNCCKKEKLNNIKICQNTIASFGLAGGRSVKERKIIKNKFNFFKKTIISTDGYIALVAATKGNPGAILNIGTGVVSHIMLKGGGSQQLSGWGYPCGDIGGGWWIGIKSISETLKKIDGYSYYKDIIYKKIQKKIGSKDTKIISWLSNSDAKKFAEIASIVFKIKKKSRIANNIIIEGKNEIEKILKYILKEKKIRKIYCMGGLMKFYAPLLSKNFTKHLIYNKIDPLLGAYLISKRMCPTEKLINDKRTYR